MFANQRGRIPCFWIISTDDDDDIAEEWGGGIGNTLRMHLDDGRLCRSMEWRRGGRRFRSGVKE